MHSRNRRANHTNYQDTNCSLAVTGLVCVFAMPQDIQPVSLDRCLFFQTTTPNTSYDVSVLVT